MKENGFMAESMAMALGSKKKAEIPMWVNGEMERPQDTGFTQVSLDKSMRGLGSTLVKMEKALKHFQTVKFTLETIKQVILKAQVK